MIYQLLYLFTLFIGTADAKFLNHSRQLVENDHYNLRRLGVPSHTRAPPVKHTNTNSATLKHQHEVELAAANHAHSSSMKPKTPSRNSKASRNVKSEVRPESKVRGDEIIMPQMPAQKIMPQMPAPRRTNTKKRTTAKKSKTVNLEEGRPVIKNSASRNHDEGLPALKKTNSNNHDDFPVFPPDHVIELKPPAAKKTFLEENPDIMPFTPFTVKSALKGRNGSTVKKTVDFAKKDTIFYKDGVVERVRGKAHQAEKSSKKMKNRG